MTREMTRDEKVAIGRELAGRLLGRHGEDAIVAVGLHGSVARGDDGADLDVAVVTAGPEVQVPDRVLRHRGLVVDLAAIDQQAYLDEAAHVGPAWPLAADQYVRTLPLHDPAGFFERLREAHERGARETGDEVFRAAAGYDLAQALDQEAVARRAERAGDDVAAVFAVREAAVLAALTLGLLSRMTWPDAAAALRGAGAVTVPPGFADAFRLAVAPDSDVALAVAALGEALDALTELARRDAVPFEADDLDAFL
jgi:hypothetical protein